MARVKFSLTQGGVKNSQVRPIVSVLLWNDLKKRMARVYFGHLDEFSLLSLHFAILGAHRALRPVVQQRSNEIRPLVVVAQ